MSEVIKTASVQHQLDVTYTEQVRQLLGQTSTGLVGARWVHRSNGFLLISRCYNLIPLTFGKKVRAPERQTSQCWHCSPPLDLFCAPICCGCCMRQVDLLCADVGSLAGDPRLLLARCMMFPLCGHHRSRAGFLRITRLVSAS